jgi:hypothetical protein
MVGVSRVRLQAVGVGACVPVGAVVRIGHVCERVTTCCGIDDAAPAAPWAVVAEADIQPARILRSVYNFSVLTT